MSQALCAEYEEDYWFPVSNSQGKKSAEQRREAKRICAECPVLGDCLEHSLIYEEHGIWAGTSANERKRIRKERGIKVQVYGFQLDLAEIGGR